MARFLTQEWLDELQRICTETLTGNGPASAAVQFHVTGGPNGDVAYFWRVRDGSFVDAGLSTIAEPDFSVAMSYDDAARLYRGDVDPGTLFLQDGMEVTGVALSSPLTAWRSMATFFSLLFLGFSAESEEIRKQLGAVTTY